MYDTPLHRPQIRGIGPAPCAAGTPAAVAAPVTGFCEALAITCSAGKWLNVAHRWHYRHVLEHNESCRVLLNRLDYAALLAFKNLPCGALLPILWRGLIALIRAYDQSSFLGPYVFHQAAYLRVRHDAPPGPVKPFFVSLYCVDAIQGVAGNQSEAGTGALMEALAQIGRAHV